MSYVVYKVEENGRFSLNVPLDKESFLLAGFSEKVYLSELAKYQWTIIRKQRDSLIALTDWTQMSDAKLTDEKKQEFLVYRQSLRDIPQQYDSPDDVVWPDEPVISTEDKIAS